MATIDFGGTKEEVVTRDEFPVAKAREVLKDETIAVIGYGVQGPAQALNMKDNGFNVIIGQAKRFAKDWDRAVADGWVPGETLFEIDEAARRGTIIQMLVSDAAQKAIWPTIKECLNEGDALYFSHGFSIVYKDQTGVVPPPNVDVILVAPKGSGLNVRRNFLSGAGINSSFGVAQDFTGRARERTLALGIAVGSGFLFPTTFENEVYSDLTGERGILMGALAQRGVQRERRGADPEPDPPGGRERHGLDVRQLLRHRPARRFGLASPIQRGSLAGVQGALPAGEERR
jgi:ketol-acid reductoisomerase